MYRNPNFVGVAIHLRDPEGMEIKLQPDGHVGHLGTGTFTLGIDIDSSRVRGTCFEVTNDPDLPGNKILKRIDPAHIGERFVNFEMKVEVTSTERKRGRGWQQINTTRYPKNNMHFLHVLPGGKVEDWMLSLTSQDGDCFLAFTKTYEAQAYIGLEGKLVYPDFEQRVGLGEIHKDFIEGHYVPLIENYAPPPPKEEPKLTVDRTAVILWWNNGMQTGAARAFVDGQLIEVKVYWRNVHAKRERLVHLIPGEIVTIAGIEPITGSGFTHQAIGIQPHDDFTVAEPASA